MKFLVTLKEVNNFITYLRDIEIVWWERTTFENVWLFNFFSLCGQLWSMEYSDFFCQLSTLFVWFEVFYISTEDAYVILIFIISSQHIELITIMPMELSITIHTLRSSPRKQTPVASVALIIHQVLNSYGNVIPLVLCFIILDILVHWETSVMKEVMPGLWLDLVFILRFKNFLCLTLANEGSN